MSAHASGASPSISAKSDLEVGFPASFRGLADIGMLQLGGNGLTVFIQLCNTVRNE